MEAKPSARPRSVTNHFDTATEATNIPTIAAPPAITKPRRTSHCQSSVTWLIRTSAGTSRTMPASMTGRVPSRSTYGPTRMPTAAMTRCAIVSARKSSLRLQSSPSVIGLVKAPITPVCAPTAMNCVARAAPTMTQP